MYTNKDKLYLQTKDMPILKKEIEEDVWYKCEKCGKFHKNIMANDDDINMIIKISKKC